MPDSKKDEELFYRQVGSRIREHRTERGTTQARLAEQLGMTRASVGNIEAGRQRIQLHTLAWLALHLNTSIHDLIPTRIETDRIGGALPHEEAQFTDVAARSFVERVLSQANSRIDS